VTGSAPRRQRRLALGVLLAAAALAVAVFPIRGTWWGGWILAIAEAGIVGGLADWFAVTAIFRRPLGLPIPHTALIPANWELMAARVGTMVGSRVLTKEYVAQEVARVDVASMIARAVERLTTRDLDTATRELARWLAAELSPKAAGDLVTRLRDLLLDRPLAPVLAAALELARRHEWDQRGVTALSGAMAEALDRPAFRSMVGEVVGDLGQVRAQGADDAVESQGVGHHARQVALGHEVAVADDGAQLEGLAGCEEFNVQTERLRLRDQAADLFHAQRARGQTQTPYLSPVGIDPGFLQQATIQLDAVHDHPRQVVGAAQLADESGGAVGRPAREGAPLYQDDVAPSHLRQVVRDAAPGHAAADDDRLCFVTHCV